MNEEQYFRANFMHADGTPMQAWQRPPRTAGHPPPGTPARSGVVPAEFIHTLQKPARRAWSEAQPSLQERHQ